MRDMAFRPAVCDGKDRKNGRKVVRAEDCFYFYTMLKNFLVIALGGALGSMGRYALTVLGSHLAVRGEWTTLAANLCGSFLIGLAMPGARSEFYLFFTVGVCGGFTTYSTFSSQAMRLLHDGQYGTGLLYVLATTVLSLFMVWCGWYCRQRIWG